MCVSLKNNLSIGLKPTFFIVLLLITSIIMSIMLLMQYKSNKTLAFNSTSKSFSNLSTKIVSQLQQYDQSSENFISILENLQSITSIPKTDTQYPLLKVITSHLEKNPYIYALYVGNIDGNFYEVINVSEEIKKQIKVPKDTRWMIVKIVDHNGIQYEEFLDKNLKQIYKKKIKSSYNPSKRPWFKKALLTKKFVKVEPYKYSNIDKQGITYSKMISQHGDFVIGLDITLDSVDRLLEEQNLPPESELFLHKNNGDIIAYEYKSNNVKEKHTNIKEYYPNLLDTKPDTLNIRLNNKDYYHYKSLILAQDNYKEYLQIITPINVIMAPFLREMYKSVVITLIFFVIVVIPLIFYSAKLITGPISQIAHENEKIKNGNFKNIKYVKTFIVEIDELSLSLQDMAQSIQKFQENQKRLMDSFIQLIATAIDEKSKYTGGHCSRVPELSLKIMEAASEAQDGEFKEFTIENEEQKRELSISAWLHDCGKVTTPEYVVDKATKLETIYNRIHEIRTRFEVLYRDLIIESYEKINKGETKQTVQVWLETEHTKLQEDFAFLANANIGGEFMKDEDIEHIKNIASKTWQRHFDNRLGLSNIELERFKDNVETLPTTEYLLDDKPWHIVKRIDLKAKQEEYKKYGFKMEIPEHLYNLGEIYNLCIKKGTLTQEERHKINEHVSTTIKMLEELPFTNALKNVPKFAGGHHETLIGTGYPKKLHKEDMPLASRIIALADVFEALTASDRPYKEKKKLSESIKILGFMVKDKHIDKELFKLFLESGIYLQYAHEFLHEDQIDEVDIEQYLT